MLRDRSPRVTSGLACLVCLVFLSGCKIEFEANTVVSPDGSVTRTTRYVGDEDSDRKELETQYALPVGGTWETKKTTVPNAAFKGNEYVKTTSIYQVTKRYAPGQSVPSDYVRKGKSPERVSQNDVHLRVRDYIFAKTFDYEEHFRDVTSAKGFETAARKLYAAWLEYFAGQLAQELGDRVTLAQAREALRATYDPLVNKFITLARNEGQASPDAGSKIYEQAIEPALKTEQVVSQVSKALPPPSDEEA